VRRREFITFVGGTAVAWPLAARGQQPTSPVVQPRAPLPHVGILNYATDDDIRIRQFRAAIADLGYIEGKNLILTLRSADGVFDRLPGFAAELVAAKDDVIIALGPATWAARQATTSIPIIVAFSGDMVEMGVVESLARPGGNVTGFSYMSGDLAEKRLELLTSAFSRSRRIGVLYNPREPATKGELASTEAAALTLKVELAPMAAQTPEELEAAFRTATAQQLDGFIVLVHGFAVLNGPRIIALAAQHRVPVLYGWRDFVTNGGLMSYGPDIEGLVRGAAQQVDRILKGASPADLPVEQPTRLIFSVNLKTAQALGITIPPALLARVDEVIE
jgi:putative tryptophan/tyrosine transport system substrate-binding protein